jgi:hypothetical protein
MTSFPSGSDRHGLPVEVVDAFHGVELAEGHLHRHPYLDVVDLAVSHHAHHATTAV